MMPQSYGPTTTAPQRPHPTAAYLRHQLAELDRTERLNRQGRRQLERQLRQVMGAAN